MRGRDAHSRTVFWLKIALPLLALGVLSTLFLFSRDLGPEGLIPFSDVDVEELAREQRLTAPEFTGVTSDGASLTVRAALALPGEGGSASAEMLEAIYERDRGMVVRLLAARGRMDPGKGLLSLEGNVQVTTSAGYTLEAERLEAALDRTSLTAPGEVRAEAPYGDLTAGSMTLMPGDGETKGEVLVFKDGVRLIYSPKE
jgi:lipopolysaccharide export system protein LptC